MATARLAQQALGSVVWLKENGASAEFIVGRHDYESGRNGTGRTLLIRKNVLPDSQRWRTVDSTTDLSWDKADLKEWLEKTYLQRLDPDIQRCIGTTKYACSKNNRDYYTVEGSVFILSAAELGYQNSRVWYTTEDGTKLDDAVLTALRSGSGDTLWTRTPNPDSQKEDGEDMEHYWYTRVYVCKNNVIEDSGYPDAEYERAWIKPCFTVPDNLRVEEDGTLCENHAPLLSCFYENNGDIGSCAKPLSFQYAVADTDGDTMTVTESVGGTTLKQYTVTSESYTTETFTLSQAVWSALDCDQYYEVKITVTDGEQTTSWASRFLKTMQRGYRVFAGTITDKVNGAQIASGSYTFATLECIYDPSLENAGVILLDPEVNLTKNDPGSFEFTLPQDNSYYDKIQPKKTVILVEEDGAELFTGYVTEISKNFKMDKQIYCKGELGYLKDISMVLAPKEYTVAELFTAVVKATESAGVKSFRLGKVSAEFESEKISTKDSGTQYTTAWNVLNDILLANVGGILRLRKRRDKTTNYGIGYTRYLDFLVDIEEKTDQMIQFGRNLLDLDYRIQADEIVNRVKVYGYTTSGFWFWKTTDQIVEVVEDKDSIEKYGVCERCILVEGTASTRESLRRAGEKYLNENAVGVTGSFTLNALDLRDAGVDVGRLCFLKRTHVHSDPHGIDDWPYCSAERIPLDTPEEKEFTFGETLDSFTKKQASTSAVAKRAMSIVNSVVSYVSGS